MPEAVEEQRGGRPRDISLAFFETLFEAGPFGLGLFDAHGRYVRVNSALAEMNGLDAEQHAGRTVEEVLPGLAEQLREPLATVLAGGEPATIEIRGATAARPGVRRQWVISFYPVSAGGREHGVGVVVLEVTAQRDAEGQRARLLDLERAARAAAQRAEERAAFLAEAGMQLDASLDLRTTLDTLARIAVPTLADWCTIHLLDGEEIRCAAIAHPDRARESLAWEIEARYPAALDSDGGPGAVIRTSRPEHVREVTDEGIGAVSTDAEHAAMLRRLGLSASLVVPLRARERVLGAIGFALAEPGRGFSSEDVKLAEETARRAALAIDNARLHTELRRGEEAQRFLTRASDLLAASLDWETTCQSIARLAIDGGLADWCSVDVVEPTGEVRPVALEHAQPEKLPLVAEMRAAFPVEPVSNYVGTVLRSGRSQLHAEIDDATYEAVAIDAAHLRFLREVGTRSVMLVPMVARGHTVGAITLARCDEDHPYGPEDLSLAEELSRRAATAADNARLYGDRSRVARTLQESLLPARLPEVPELDVAARFRAAGDGGEVGGDFYDVFPCGERCWGAVIGDVCGKGAVAATLTSLARHTVRAAARYETGPALLLGALNDAVLAQKREDMRFVTAMFVRLAPDERGMKATYARGGHVPPFILRAGGEVEVLVPDGPLLGIVEAAVLEERETVLEPGDALVLYTDGVTEAGAPEDPFGEERLAELLAGCAGSAADEIADEIVDTALAIQDGRPRDDIAVLVLRCTGEG